MLYSVKIKKGFGLWAKYVNIENDWTLIDYMPNFPKRVIIDKDKNTTEINFKDNIVVLSKERSSLRLVNDLNLPTPFIFNNFLITILFYFLSLGGSGSSKDSIFCN